MRNISYRAARHPWPARLSIAVLMAGLHGLGISLAGLLRAADIRLGEYFFPATMLVALLAVAGYPARHRHRLIRHRYIRQKACDFALAACTFCTIVSFATSLNTDARPARSPSAYASQFPIRANAAGNARAAGERNLFGRAKARAGIYKALPGRGGKGGLIALVIVAAVILCMAVAVLACALACSGAEVLVGVGGITGIIFGAVYLIKDIKRKARGERGRGHRD